MTAPNTQPTSSVIVALLAIVLASASPAAHGAPPTPLATAVSRLDLPITLVVAEPTHAYLVFLTGDGGWASLDRAFAESLRTQGVTTLGWSSFKYFFRRKVPRQVTADLRRVLAVLEPLGRPVYLGGYSFGAEMVPVTLVQLTTTERRAIAGLVLLAPSASASFQVDPLDWVREPAVDPSHRVDDAIRRLDGLRILCLTGVDDKGSVCPTLGALAGVEVVTLPGDHHFQGDAKRLATVAMERLFQPPP